MIVELEVVDLARVNLTDGKIKPTADFSYVLDGKQLDDGMILACQSRAQTPVSIDVSIDGEAKVSATKKYMGSVKKVTSLTHDIMELTLEVDGLEHTGAAGQYSEVLVKQVGSTRSYSFAKAPQNENSNELTFYIRNVPKGRFSRWLFGKDPTGQKIEVNTPYGSFYYRDGKGTMVCIAGGSGMSAVKAVLEQAAIDQVQRDAVFLFGARTQEDIYCQAELEEIQKKWNPDYKFEYVYVLNMEPEDSDWTGARGLVTDFLKSDYIEKGKTRYESVSGFLMWTTTDD